MKKIINSLRNNKRKIRFVLFSAYCLFIVYYTLLSREMSEERKIDLRFMWSYREMITGHPDWKIDVMQNLANILFFVPFGFLFPEKKGTRHIFKALSKWQYVLFMGILFSVFIEIMQYITCYGLCELDDVICNGLGALAGYLISRLVNIIWVNISKL